MVPDDKHGKAMTEALRDRSSSSTIGEFDVQISAGIGAATENAELEDATRANPTKGASGFGSPTGFAAPEPWI